MSKVQSAFLVMFILCLLAEFGCNKDEEPCLTCPPPYQKNFFVDTLLIEPNAAWLRIYRKDSVNLGAVELYRDHISIFAGTISHFDTTIIDANLLPSTVHIYTAYRLRGGTRSDSSGSLNVKTMDTTSHNFVWQTETFGEAASSYFQDVAIINDTCIWVVGTVYLKDSSGNTDPQPYNVAKWNGVRWQLQRATVTYLGNQINVPLQGIFAFSPTDIWLMGGSPIHGNGASWVLFQIQGWGLRVDASRAWGTSYSNMYFVGYEGSIAHFDGHFWTKIESGTTLQVQDIWGTQATPSSAPKIYAVASNKYSNQGKLVMQIQGQSATPSSDSGLPWSLSGIWFNREQLRYAVGDGVFKKYGFGQDTSWHEFQYGLTTYYTEAIRGQAENDIAVAGDYGEVLHFNGTTWRSFYSQTALSYGAYYGVAIHGNIICAVGGNGSRAVITIGRR